jgi:hypothetical protein
MTSAPDWLGLSFEERASGRPAFPARALASEQALFWALARVREQMRRLRQAYPLPAAASI